jgi:hypothetical protein
VIVVAGKRWQGDTTVSYRRGTETNGVQRSKDLTVISQEIFDRTPSTYPVVCVKLGIPVEDEVEKSLLL